MRSYRSQSLVKWSFIITISILLLIQLLPAPYPVFAQNDTRADIQRLFQPIDKDIRNFLSTPEQKNFESVENFTIMLSRKYNSNLDSIITLLGENEPSLPTLTQEKRQQLKLLVLAEHLNRLHQETLDLGVPFRREELFLSKRQKKKDDGGLTHLNYNDLSAGSYPINHWIQVSDDINGGQGVDDANYQYNINGGNDLYKLVIYYYSGDKVKYELWFHDEDNPDPSLDAWWDSVRMIIYGRVEDVESFYIENNVIHFDNIWCSDRTFAYSIGQHGTIARSYVDTIYVSNVWNHAMDTVDTNPSLGKTWLYFP